MKKLFAFDLDGTLLNSESKFHLETIDALNKAKEKGHYLAIATGRGVASTSIFLDQFANFDFLICNNGTVVYDVKNKKTLIKSYLPKEYLYTLIEEAKRTHSFFTLSTEKKVYPYKKEGDDFSWLNEQELMDYSAQGFKSEQEIYDAIEKNGEKITQLALRNSEDKVKALAEKYRNIFKDNATCLVTNRVYFDVNPAKTDKFYGILTALEELNLTTENLVTFGDSGNDVMMIENAKFGFAMGNATPEAKAVSVEAIGHFNSDAIAKKILELI
ncbi:HAD family hydrolase [Mesomycoplasma lagogenitalium]|uniref:HAD family hydrolase n=1 Tax=Mesomycoplasma lagogenitalium TaxID=171286 RepID=A0ABY8LTR0_9BACT|nr:HAD family hydrolase [Mesomycoplasma lagogenitalium]WGI36623.1 HAD family hydrolase [Mesomycoplasma lagogenitalium]